MVWARPGDAAVILLLAAGCGSSQSGNPVEVATRMGMATRAGMGTRRQGGGTYSNFGCVATLDLKSGGKADMTMVR